MYMYKVALTWCPTKKQFLSEINRKRNTFLFFLFLFLVFLLNGISRKCDIERLISIAVECFFILHSY